MVEQSQKRELKEFLYFVTLVIAACFLTVLDVTHFTLYLTYWIPALLAVAIPTIICFNEPSRSRLALLGLLILWVILLPQIRWDRTKSFFIDAHRLQVGMTKVEARKIMEPYLRFEDGNSVRFKPEEGGGDGCIVHFRDDKIAQIKITID